MNESKSKQDLRNLGCLANFPDLAVRQAVADHYSSPQADTGSLRTAILDAAGSGRWEEGLNKLQEGCIVWNDAGEQASIAATPIVEEE